VDHHTVVINATSIGRVLGGIGVYGVLLIKALARADMPLRFRVVLNEAARPHFADTAFPPSMSVRFLPAALSPDRGSRGHLLRWLHATQLALRSGRKLLFGTSQIEAPLLGAPGIVTVHDTIPLLFENLHPRQRHFYRHVLGPALRGAAAVITPSQATKSLLEQCYRLPGEKIRVIPHGASVPVRRREERASHRDPFILCIGRPNPIKNVGTLLAAHRLLRRHMRVSVVFVGGASPFPLAAGDEDVDFRGNVSDAEKLDLLDRASVLVCPSLYEGFGFPPLEAMARGCPIVISNTGSLPEVGGDAARYIDPRDAPALATALYEVLTDEDLRARMVESGYRRVRAFTWEGSARQHVGLFEEVLALRERRLAEAPVIG
jgi:glycosyltransferase involved in cell wall biosynthesis